MFLQPEPSATLSSYLNPSDHLQPLQPIPATPLSSTEGDPHNLEGVISPLLSTEGTLVPVASPCPSHRSMAGKLLDHLTLLATYDSPHKIHRHTPPGSTQHVFCTNSNQCLPRVSGMELHNSYLGNLRSSTLLSIYTSKLVGTLHSLIAEHQQCLGCSLLSTPLVNYLNPAILQTMVNKADTPTFTEAIDGPTSTGFHKAMELDTAYPYHGYPTWP